MSAMNPPCNAELTFMRILPARIAELTDAVRQLSAAVEAGNDRKGKPEHE